MNKMEANQKRRINTKQRGELIVVLALMLVMFSSFVALSVDIGHIFLIRNELQNAADAIALEGASYLFPSTGATGNPNWTLATTKAQGGISRNKVGNVSLSNADISLGYWRLTGSLSALLPTTTVPGSNEAAAVQVTVSKSAGKNGGPVQLYFGTLLGMGTVNVSATAIAVSGSPGSVNANTLFPVAMAQGLYDQYWDKTTAQPKIDPSTGQPYVFRISEGADGGWSTFNQALNDTPSIINIITSGNPIPLSIGSEVWMATGVKTAVYGSVPSNKDVLVAVAAQSTPGSFQPIVAFAPLHIDFALGGSSKYIQVHFIKDYKFTEGEIGGPYYGAYMPPRLAK